LTPRGKKVIELAADEARRAGNRHIGTEHLLAGLGRAERLGVTVERVRGEAARLAESEPRES
jgi:ATP-dependent Clp protease ATP-binding subunit ClpC